MHTNVIEDSELWKKIEGDWKHEYYISTKGRVRYYFKSKGKSRFKKSEDRWKYLAIIHNKQMGFGNGYLSCSLGILDKIYTAYIHRLIAVAFIPNPHNKPQVNHIDGNSINNSIDNLEWVTAKENVNHAWDNGLIKREVNGIYKRRTPSIYNKVFELRKQGLSQPKIAALVHIDQPSVSRILNNKTRLTTK